MYIKSAGVALCGVAMLTLAVVAKEKPPDSYVKLMKTVGAASGSVRKMAEAKDYAAVAKDAGTLKGAFADVEKFWTEKKVDDAIAAAKAGAKAAADIETAANAKSDEGIAAAVKSLTGACGSCHTAHRTKLEDGTFEIK